VTVVYRVRSKTDVQYRGEGKCRKLSQLRDPIGYESILWANCDARSMRDIHVWTRGVKFALLPRRSIVHASGSS